MRRTLIFLVLFAWLPLFALVPDYAGRAADEVPAQMYYRTWNLKDGLPESLSSASADSDGFLWIGSDSGLYRFDGLTLKRYSVATDHLLADEVVAVLAPSSGGVWIGYQFGGASFLKDGKIETYQPGEKGLPGGSVRDLVEYRGAVLIATSRGIARYDKLHWTRIDLDGVYSGQAGFTAKVDKWGGLWTGRYSGTLRWSRAPSQPSQRTEIVTPYGLALSSPERGWISGESDFSSLLRSVDGHWTSEPSGLHQSVSKLLLDTAGDLWLASDVGRLFRLRARALQARPPLDRKALEPIEEPFNPGPFMAAVEDREQGNWFVQTRGISYIHRTAFHAINNSWVRSEHAIANFGTSLIIASEDDRHSIYESRGGKGRAFLHAKDSVSCLYADPKGGVWIGSNDGTIIHLAGASRTTLSLPLNPDNTLRAIQAFGMDGEGALWVSVIGESPSRYKDGVWSRVPEIQDDPQVTPVSLLGLHDGSMLLGYRSNNLTLYSVGKVSKFTEKQGFHLGNTNVMVEHGDHVWLGGTAGVTLFRQGKFVSIRTEPKVDIGGVTGIVERANGDLWLNTKAGAVRMLAADLDRARVDGEYRVPVKLLNYQDGYPGSANQIRPLPSLVEGQDGKLYFSSSELVSWLDPNQLVDNSRPPTVVLDRIVVDGQSHGPVDGLRIKKKAQEVEFHFAVGTLFQPERTEVRYKLEGFDQDWQDAGQRRQATYPRLPPGRYTFRVKAKNSSGVSSLHDATVSVYLPPTFLQSGWFALACVVAGALSIWVLYVVRLQYATEQVKLIFQERRDERERIAGDLHDSFFQGMQGVLLRFLAATESLPQNAVARRRFERILQESDQVMLEGRELVFELRSGASASADLPSAIAELGAEMESIHGIPFATNVEGTPRPLAPIAAEELLKITREAMWNAYRHSGSPSVCTEIRFRPHEMTISVVDLGVGIPPEILSSGSRLGHWGLPGMKARAEKIKATLLIRSRPDLTVVEIKIPASIIYDRKQGRFWASICKFKARRRRRIFSRDIQSDQAAGRDSQETTAIASDR